MVKRNFVRMLRELCMKHDLEIVTFCDEWVSQITDKKTGKVVRIIGYSFPLNNQVSSLSANDKGLTSQLLTNANIPNIEHVYIYSDELRQDLKMKNSLEDDVDSLFTKLSLPLVVKPSKGTQGRAVYLCNSKEDVLEKVKVISAKEDVAVAPFEESEFEYRFYFLDEEIILAYKKTRTGDWKHNLSSGAVPEVLDLAECGEMAELAKRAYKELGLRIGAVDIFATKEGLKVLEVNNGVSLVHFGATSEEYYQLALGVYERYLLESFKNNSI
jgi:glutathione synthase/RimK-type ligase-like ATP-grasp enzyme